MENELRWKVTITYLSGNVSIFHAEASYDTVADGRMLYWDLGNGKSKSVPLSLIADVLEEDLDE